MSTIKNKIYNIQLQNKNSIPSVTYYKHSDVTTQWLDSDSVGDWWNKSFAV